MKNEKIGAEEIYLAPETENSEELVLDEPIEETKNEDITVMVEPESKKNVRVGEILDLRESNRKVYRMSDGTEQAVFYPETVHVFNDDTKTFDDVDNTIVEEEDGRHFVSGKNHFIAKFSKEEENDELFSIESGMHRVTVSSKKTKKSKNHGVKPRLYKKDKEGFERTDALVFEGVHNGADYEYSVTGNGVKENIVVKEKADVYRYPFVLRMENVTAKYDDANKRVAFLSEENGEEVFFIPSPFMTDANGVISTAVSYELKNATNGDAVITVTSDSEWMNEEERAYPVVIDPQIQVSGTSAMTTYSWANGSVYSASLHTVGTTGCGDGTCNAKRMYMTFKMPTLPRNPRIKKAELKFCQASSSSACCNDAKIGLYSVTDAVGAGNCTPNYDDNLIDFAKMQIGHCEDGEIVSYTFDVTTLVDKVNKGEQGVKNLVLKMIDETAVCDKSIMLYGSAYSGDYAPQFIVTYESTYGINTSYRTHTHELGRFGQGSIDLQCGNLMFESEDFAWAGNRMPVTIKHLYNSALSQHKYTSNDDIKLSVADFSDMNVGLGWKINVMQGVKYDSNADTYIFTDENGKEKYFLLSDKTTKCDSNSQCYQLYEDSEGNEMYYDNRRNALTYEDTRYFFDYSGRLIKVVNENNEMNIHYTSGKITSVTDSCGRDFCFAYNINGELTSITAPDYSAENRNVITYSYTNNLLTKIVYPDGISVEIEYNSQMPSAVILKDTNEKALYKVEYTFNGQRLASVTEFGVENGEFVLGESSHYEYSAASNRTVVTVTKPKDEILAESKDTVISTVYTFNDDGECIGEYSYNSDDENLKYVTGENVISTLGYINNIDNLLLNHNFTGLDNWVSEPSNCGTVHISNYAYEPYAKFGNKVLRIQTNADSCCDNGVYQDTVMLQAGEYAFSTHIRVLSTFKGVNKAGAYIRVTSTDGKILAESERISKYNTEYIRLVTPFTLESAQSVKVHLMLDGDGAAYYDAVQLEKNSYANAYNMLLNSNFERNDIGWVSDGCFEISSDEHFNMLHSLKLIGSLNSKNIVKQQVPVKANRGTRETFTLSGWAKGRSLPYTDRENCEQNEFSLSAVIKYSDGTEETHTASFSPCTDEWQPASVQFAKSKYKIVSKLTVNCNYNYNTGVAYFDNIQLIRNSIETNLSEKDFASGTVEEEIVAKEETSKFEEVKDAYGNAITETTFTDGEFGTIYRSFEYSSNCNGYDNCGNDLVGETDARGNRTVYIVDEDTSRKEEIIDRLGNKMAYEYDINGKISKEINKSSDDKILSTVSYDYDEFNNLKEITRGDQMQYSLIYNGFHNLAEIRIKEKDESLLSYTYKKGNGRLKEMSFANGHVMKATYNGDGQLISEKWFNSATNIEPMAYYRYVYDSAGNIVRSIDIKALKEYNYTYESGRITRSAEYDITLDEILNVISKNVVSTIDYVYNEKGMLSKKTISANGSEIVYYTEYSENANSVTKIKVNGRNIESHSKTDSFGRKVFDEIQLGSGFVSRQFSYHAGKVTDEHKQNGKLKSSPTTNLVSGIVLSNGTTLTYAYDAEEHITSVTETYDVDGVPVVKVTSYTYDALGQLKTETSNGITTKFEYDNYGNITAKGVATENGDIIPETKIEYTYDSVWKDKLISFNGQEIVYDTQGNPIEYLGHNLTWEKGRQLKSFDNHSYTYNANGIRTSKNVDGCELHEYVLDGSKILKESWNGNNLIPLYDNTDSVCGIIYNNISYFFLKNLQGDIIAITNGERDTVARYSYDAWGKCTVTQDTTIQGISTINPFRYRGYYLDDKTGLYYLNSRYYDPNTGRFINSDSPEYVSIQGGNLFTYCGNCPTKNADYFGFCYVPTYPESNNTSANTTEKKHFDIPAWMVASAIDLALLFSAPYVTTTYTTTMGSILALLKLDVAKNFALRLIRGAVPKIVGVLGGVLTLIREIIWRVTGVALYFLADGIFSSMLNSLDFIKIIEIGNMLLTLSTAGGIISLMLDRATDGVFNDKIRLW